MPTYVLKPSHPTMEKIRKIDSLMEELGISYELVGGEIFVTDRDQPNREFRMRDLEGDIVTSIPHQFDIKLTFNKEE